MTDAVKPPEPALVEIATTRDGRDITRGFVDVLKLLLPQDAVLMLRGGGDYLLYEEILRDDQVMATLQQRRNSVVSKEWYVTPGGESPNDVAAAQFLEEQLDRINLDRVTDKMLYGVYYGFAVGECLYAIEGSRVVLDAVKVRNRRRFAFAPDGSLRLKTTRNPQGEELPERKFWTFATGADNDDEPYGRGLGYWLYWYVFFKRHGLKFWLIFLDKFSVGTALGKYRRGATKEEQDKLLAALGAIQSDAGVAIPDDMDVKILEAMRSGNIDQRTFHETMDAAISKIVVGQTMTTDDGSSLAQGKVHMDVREDIVQSDADLVCSSFNATVARWLTEWNFPPGTMPPQVWRKVKRADLLTQAKIEQTVSTMGVARPTLKHIQDTYGGEWEAKPAPPAPMLLPPSPSDDPEFAERERDAVDGFGDQLDDAAGEVLDGMIGKVKELVESAQSFDEIRERLADLYGDLDPARLADLVQRAMAAAELAGRTEVLDEA